MRAPMNTMTAVRLAGRLAGGCGRSDHGPFRICSQSAQTRRAQVRAGCYFRGGRGVKAPSQASSVGGDAAQPDQRRTSTARTAPRAAKRG